MPRKRRARVREPELRRGLFLFGKHHRFLDREEAIKATPEERIRSVWPFIANQAMLFERSLHPRERANFDAEDAAQELWIAIAERDHKWNPEKGDYISFVGSIIHNCLYTLRERSRSVQSPRNTSCRLNGYKEAELNGKLSQKQAKTRSDINRTISGIMPINEVSANIPSSVDVDADVSTSEGRQIAIDAVKRAVESLPVVEAAIISKVNGLWGSERLTVPQIAAEMQKTPDQIRRAKNRAYSRIVAFLEETSHPSTEKDVTTDEHYEPDHY
jgi:RNA polymerase sigma factor (sigma-70 family)